MFNIQIEKSGLFKITASNAGRHYLKEQNTTGIFLLYDMLAPFSCRGSFTPFDASQANPFVGLTSVPCIAESMKYDEKGHAEIVGRCWYFADYQTTDFAECLKDRGVVRFALAKASGF